MASAASRAAASVQGADGRHLTYLEHPERNHSYLVDSAKYFQARSPAEKQAAILRQGPIPAPPPHEVASALHTLQFAGVSPLSPNAMRAAYMDHVIVPLHPPATPADVQHFQTALAGSLPLHTRALYEARLRAAGK